MKYKFLILISVFSIPVFSQNIQLHYDFRHSLDPDHNLKNFPTLYFEYFKSQDSGSFFLKPGSFLIKIQTDFLGEGNNPGKFYTQVSQSFRFWKPKIYLHLEYSGGLGIAEPGSYGYYITNGFSLGASHLISRNGGFYNFSLSYRYNNFKRPSNDAMLSFYWWKGFWNYKIELAGDIEVWTQNKNHGDAGTINLTGKIISIFGEPQFWFNVSRKFSLGSKVNLYYHVLTNENIFQVYPTIAFRYKI